jgi:hypothetical protein
MGTIAIYHADTTRIATILIKTINHQYSKIVSQGLRVSGSFINTFTDQFGALNP